MSKNASDFQTGDQVVYTPGHANGDTGHPDAEVGFVTSTNAVTVFVDYNRQGRGKPTSPGDLTLLRRGGDAPLNKGQYNGTCYRSACDRHPAPWYNHSTGHYYCTTCAFDINQANHADAMRLFGHELCTRGEHVEVS
ncbi:hypothetical protein FAES_3928 [Fibrella aestuarina BUZ 2]|uniref:Uncharacterized protein n=1 Tax=Fibrella aestuarina BUZ 2 TaxID=1166018 RepID=I0KCT1_9BACT|nr:hypothetical protein [Fibrella aestuarina]CCH01934.1 hypothetical protein FAES_3928 [Fibrella aestuarina BUZ 2]